MARKRNKREASVKLGSKRLLIAFGLTVDT